MSNDTVETDPEGRYVRSNEELGRGAYKVVYKAIDRDQGLEVAWNQIRLEQGTDFVKLWKEILILQQLNHPNIIGYHHAWVDEQKLQVVFITECMTSGTLKHFIRKAQKVKLKVIKNWCTQILEGLRYLHTRDPSIIHRDIKCDNIFINGALGQVKIGDLGLATILSQTGAALKQSIIGTPEFMAPEFYEEKYDEKVDVWAFGMSVLEMVTLEYPFSECDNPAQIFRKVSTGQKPKGLARIIDPEVYRFIDDCLQPYEHRLSAAELLKHPFLVHLDDEIGNNNNQIQLRTEQEAEAWLDAVKANGLPAEYLPTWQQPHGINQVHNLSGSVAMAPPTAAAPSASGSAVVTPASGSASATPHASPPTSSHSSPPHGVAGTISRRPSAHIDPQPQPAGALAAGPSNAAAPAADDEDGEEEEDEEEDEYDEEDEEDEEYEDDEPVTPQSASVPVQTGPSSSAPPPTPRPAVPKLGLQSLQPQPVDAIIVNPGRSSTEVAFPSHLPDIADASATASQDMISLSIDALEQRIPAGASVTSSEQPRDLNVISLRFSLAIGDQSTVIEFDYNISKDTPTQVATEMVRELQLADSSIPMIADYLDAKVEEYIQGHSLVTPDQPRPRRSWTAQDQLSHPLRINSPRRTSAKSRLEPTDVTEVDGMLAPPAVPVVPVQESSEPQPIANVKPKRRKGVGTIAGDKPGRLRERVGSTSSLPRRMKKPVIKKSTSQVDVLQKSPSENSISVDLLVRQEKERQELMAQSQALAQRHAKEREEMRRQTNSPRPQPHTEDHHHEDNNGHDLAELESLKEMLKQNNANFETALLAFDQASMAADDDNNVESEPQLVEQVASREASH